MNKFQNSCLLALILIGLPMHAHCNSIALRPATTSALLTLGSAGEPPILNTTPIHPEIQVPRSMWVWETHLALDVKEQVRLLDFCKLRHIDRLYLYTGKASYFTSPEQRTQLSVFITKAHDQGIAVEALDGWPEAIFPEIQLQFLDSLKRVLDYNQSVPKEARFDGFQSDVEPQTLWGYNKNLSERKKYDKHFLRLHEKCKEMIDKAGDKNFVFGIALSPKYDDEGKDQQFIWKGKQGWVADHMIKIVDYVALMSYSDTARETIRIAEYEIKLGNQSGKPVWVGNETLDVFGKNMGPKSITFAEEGVDYMEEQMAIVTRRFKEEDSFAGLAIHYYDAYRYLPSAPLWSTNYLIDSAQPLPSDARVDGELGEWSEQYILTANDEAQLIYGKNAWRGPDDLSAHIRVGWTPDSLRIVVNVQDDKLVQFKPDAMLWEGDHVEIWLHAPTQDRIYQIGFTPGDFKKMKPHSWLWYPKNIEPDLRSQLIDLLSVAAVKHDKNGYNLECSIPAEILGIEKFQAGMQIRMSCEIGDADTKEQPHETLLSVSPAFNKNKPSSFALITLEDE